MWSGAKRRLLSGGGISALRLVRLGRSVRSCAMLAEIVFFLKTKCCAQQLPPVFLQLKLLRMLEVVQTNETAASSQSELAYSGTS